MTDSILNDKIQNGLRAQYSPERITAIIEQTHSVFHYRNPQAQNSPELYELFEAGYIDEALSSLGFGKWAIGRPRLTPNHNHNGKPQPRARAFHQSVPVKPEPQSNIQPHVPRLSEILSQHLPSEFPEPKRYGDNAIEFRNVLIIGGQGSGKTTTLATLAEITAETYGHSKVRAYMQTAGIDRLLSWGTKYPSLVRVLGAEDMTLKRIDRDTLNSWFQIRHIIAQRTNWRKGLVVSVSNVHTLFGLEKNLRTDFALMILLTIPTNPYDRSLLKRYFDKDLLATFETKSQKGDALIWDRYHNTGTWVKVDYPSENLLTDVTPAVALGGLWFAFLFLLTFGIAFPLFYLFWEWLKSA